MRTALTLASTLSTISVALFLTSCAPLTESQREAIEYRRVEYAQVFTEFRRQCLAEGGRIVIFASGEVGRDGIPNTGDRYHCA